MADSTQTTRFRFWLWLIALIGVIVPRRLRADWRQEWEAELRYRETLLAEWDRLDWRNKIDLLRRSLGAFRDALLLQPRRLEDEMFQDLRYVVRMLFALACLALTVCPVAFAQAPEPFRNIRRSIEDRLAREKVPSVAVAVAKDGKLLWEDAIGWADVEKRVPATTDTMYLLGSVTKPITATALMILVERGKLALDEPANRYLGEAKLQAYIGDASRATIQRLADHTSGLARHDLNYYADERHEPLTMEERIRRYGRLLREPGETHEYSNLGYMILAHIIERQAGKSFDQFLRDEVFLPLGMTHASLGPDPKRRARAAVCYGADQKPVQERTELLSGAGGVYASVRDLLRFGLFHLKQPMGDQKRILSDKTLDLMHQPTARTGPLSWYGIGWRTEQAEFGSPALMHTGQTGGATAVLVLIPEHRLVVVALANAPHVLPWRVTQEIVERLVPQAKQPPKPTAGHERFGRQEYKPLPQWLGHWEGVIKTHERDLPVEMWFEDSGMIQVQMKNQPKTAASGVRIEDGYLRGTISGDIGASDTLGRQYQLHFKLNRRGELLNGSLTASSTPGQRVVTLSYWMELRRTL